MPDLSNRNEKSDTDSEYNDDCSSCSIIYFAIYDVPNKNNYSYEPSYYVTHVLLLHHDPAISIHNVTEENVPTPNDNDSNTDDDTDDDINVFNNTKNSDIYPYFVCTSIFFLFLILLVAVTMILMLVIVVI